MVVAVDHVGDQHGEADKVGELEDTEAGKETEPMQLVVGRAGEDGHADGGADDRGQEHPESHLRLAHTAVLTRSPRRESVGDGADGDGKDSTDEAGDGVQTSLRLRPIPRRLSDEDGETEADIQSTETDSHTVEDDSPENRGVGKERELTPERGEQTDFVVDCTPWPHAFKEGVLFGKGGWHAL